MVVGCLMTEERRMNDRHVDDLYGMMVLVFVMMILNGMMMILYGMMMKLVMMLLTARTARLRLMSLSVRCVQRYL